MDAAVQLPRRRFTVEEFARMGPLGIVPECAELVYGEVQDNTSRGTPHRWTHDQLVELEYAGILRETERIELLDGEIVCMTPIGHRHVYVVDQLNGLLNYWTRGRAIVRVQSPLHFNPVEAPYPDLVLLRVQEDRYRSRQAGPWDAVMVVEVADRSLIEDREVKGPRYARAAIPEYWIADVNAPAMIVHLNPVGGEYTNVRTFGPGESFHSPALGDRLVRVDEALGLPLPPR